MEQITAIKFTRITFKNFRRHTEQTVYDFADTIYITGDNGTGKTTMAHGIVYALYGFSAFGEQNIDRLMNENSHSTEITLCFFDQTGTVHELCRSRKGDKTSLTLDSYTVRQTDIDTMFCDRDTFLSMFNPSYMTEKLDSDKGRDLIVKHLPVIPVETVLDALSEHYRSYLNGLKITGPDKMIKDFRAEIRNTDDTLVFLEGKLDTLVSGKEANREQVMSLRTDIDEAENKLADLKAGQFKDIDLTDLSVQRDILLQTLEKEEPAGGNEEILRLQAEIEKIQNKQYESKFLQPIMEVSAQLKVLSQKFQTMKKRMQEIKPGDKCPTCFHVITGQNLNDTKFQMTTELQEISVQGTALKTQQAELKEYEEKSKAAFEKFRQDDLQRYSTQLDELLASRENTPKRSELLASISEIDEQMKFGNLSEDQYHELSTLDIEIKGFKTQIKALIEMMDENQIVSLTNQQTELNDIITSRKNIIASLAEFLAKRTEMVLEPLLMPNVEIKLFDIVRSTGEVKNTFKFTYKGRGYETLSLSEKVLAGIEIAAMVRKITKIDCPLFIDNTESISAFNDVSIPSQVFLMRVIKGQALTVRNSCNTGQLLKAG